MTAIKTPYKPDGDVDLDSYDFLVEAQIKNGVQGLIVCGTTGEGHDGLGGTPDADCSQCKQIRRPPGDRW